MIVVQSYIDLPAAFRMWAEDLFKGPMRDDHLRCLIRLYVSGVGNGLQLAGKPTDTFCTIMYPIIDDGSVIGDEWRWWL